MRQRSEYLQRRTSWQATGLFPPSELQCCGVCVRHYPSWKARSSKSTQVAVPTSRLQLTKGSQFFQEWGDNGKAEEVCLFDRLTGSAILNC
jgi:hypothetical protein